jgi:hypothetical protein
MKKKITNKPSDMDQVSNEFSLRLYSSGEPEFNIIVDKKKIISDFIYLLVEL